MTGVHVTPIFYSVGGITDIITIIQIYKYSAVLDLITLRIILMYLELSAVKDKII